jgi:Fe-S cluster assembly protein SufD
MTAQAIAPRRMELPSGRDEAWKYTPVDDILAVAYEVASRTTRVPVRSVAVDELAGDLGGLRLVFVNGYFVDALSSSARPGDGVACGVGLPGPEGEDTATVRVEPSSLVSKPVHIVHLSMPGDVATASYPRTLIDVGSAAAVTVIETYAGLGGRARTDAVTTIEVDEGAVLTHFKVQCEPLGSIHLAHTNISQTASSTVHSSSFMFGADIARNAIDVVLRGPHASLELQGLYLPNGAQRHDQVTTVEHAASAGSSRQAFKGVIDGRARGSFSGRIIVRPDTHATDAHQTTRSLLLRPTAEANARPWLEIFADDVKCTHGATVGRLDEEAMFYLRTRGIPQTEARTMLIRAFVNEMTESVEPMSLRTFLESLISSKLSSGTP